MDDPKEAVPCSVAATTRASALPASTLQDPHPRVRAAALGFLDPERNRSHSSAWQRVTFGYRSESQPFAGSPLPRLLPLNRSVRATQDPSRFVRAESIRALTSLRDQSSWES